MPIIRTIADISASAIGNCLNAAPFLNNIARYKSDSLRIVYYHLVSDQNPEYYFDGKIISPNVFQQHLRFFQKHFNIVSLSEAIRMAAEKQSLKRTLVITFDDGFAECHNIIAPILQEWKLTATFFLIGNCVDNQDLMWRNKLMVIKKKRPDKVSRLMAEAAKTFSLPDPSEYQDLLTWSFASWPMNKKEEIVNYLWKASDIGSAYEYLDDKKPYLNSQQIIAMLNEGFEIGSHSMSHPVFSKLSYEEFKSEITICTKFLEKRFRTKISSFSYPFGIKSSRNYEEQIEHEGAVQIKTFLGIKNRLDNYHEFSGWQRDNVQFPMNKMLFRLNILPLLRRLT